MNLSEQKPALLFALGGIVCLILAAVTSVSDSFQRRLPVATQRAAVDAVHKRVDKRAARLAGQLLAPLSAGEHRQLQAQVALAAQISPEVVEIGVVDADLTVLASSDPADISKTLTGPALPVVQESAAQGDIRVVDNLGAQQVLAAVPIGKPQRLATLYMVETTAALEDDLSRVVVVQPPRVPVWLVIVLGLLGLLMALVLVSLAERRQGEQVARLQEGVEQLAHGQFEVRIDPSTVPQLATIAERLNAMAQGVQELQQAQIEGSMHQSRIDQELHSAQIVQQTLMPDVRRIGRGPLQLCGVYRSMTKLSGDWWHYYPLDEHRTMVVLADVLGHGIGAAVVGAMAYGCAAQLHQEMASGLRPELLLHHLNRVIWSTTRGKYTMSCFAAIVDTKECQVIYASGAHAFPLLFRCADAQKPFIPLVASGAPLGSSEAPEFTAAMQAFSPGDLLIFYTDGLIEAANKGGDPFGEKRVRQTVQRSYKRNVEEICEILLGEVSRFVGSVNLDDDLTLVVARNLPPSSAWSNSGSNPSAVSGRLSVPPAPVDEDKPA